jgi:hypothetical protein
MHDNSSAVLLMRINRVADARLSRAAARLRACDITDVAKQLLSVAAAFALLLLTASPSPPVLRPY